MRIVEGSQPLRNNSWEVCVAKPGGAMNKFYWVTFVHQRDVTIAEQLDGTEKYMIPGSDVSFEKGELIVGSEIKFERTGFLSALNEVK